MPGQLESEIENGDWHVVPGTADFVFGAEPRKLWDELAKRGDEITADAGPP
jgi:putative AlgH/UPF0301 family transcriptional regulator